MDLRPFEAFASTHHGLLHRHAALALGASQSTWYRAIERGVFEPVHPNVIRMIGSVRTPQQRILGAVWGSGPGTLASHRSDALLWGVERPDHDPVDIILPRRARRADLDGVVTHRPRDLNELRPVIRQGIPCVVPMRMLTDLGAVVSDEEVVDALDEMFTRRIVRRGTVLGALARHGRSGHNGIGALRRALDALSIGEEIVDSKLEKRMNALLRDFRLPPAQFHAEVCGFEVDFLISGTNVVLECDGWETHGLDRDQFEFDRLRNSIVTAGGYVIVPFTWRQLTGGPAKVARRIEHNLEQWAADVLAAHRRGRRPPQLWAR